jgi:hypothetical protein
MPLGTVGYHRRSGRGGVPMRANGGFDATGHGRVPPPVGYGGFDATGHGRVPPPVGYHRATLAAGYHAGTTRAISFGYHPGYHGSPIAATMGT